MATDTLPHASIIGAEVPRIDGPLKTSGTARYAVDHISRGLHTRLPCRPPSASGRIRSLDTSAARENAGRDAGLPSRQQIQGVYRQIPHEEDGT